MEPGLGVGGGAASEALKDLLRLLPGVDGLLRDARREHGDFLARLSHEMRSPLTAIQGYAELLKAEGRDARARAEFLDVIEAHSRRLGALLDDMAVISELESDTAPEPAAAAAGAAARRAAAGLAGLAASRRVTLAVSAEPGLRAAIGEQELFRVLRQLAHNAVRLARSRATVRARRRGAEAVFVVTDDGPGVAEKDRTRIFERFYRAGSPPRKPDGTGLGLAIARMLVERRGGRIWTEPAPRGGAVFCAALPLAPQMRVKSARTP